MGSCVVSTVSRHVRASQKEHIHILMNRSCVDMREMNPNFVVAALICTFHAWSFQDEFRTHRACEYATRGIRRLGKIAHNGPFTKNFTWSPQSCNARRNWRVRAGKRLLGGAVALLFVTWSTSPCGTMEITSNHGNYQQQCHPVLDAFECALQVTSFLRFRFFPHVAC